MFRKLRVRIALFVVSLAVSLNAHSAFHLMQITEIYSNADGTVQFIELQMLGFGQNQLQGLTITSSQGATTNSYAFVGNNVSTISQGSFILIGTAGYAALPGVPTPDYVIPNNFVFTSNVTINFAGVAFASLPSVPTDGTLSINPAGATAPNSPTNNAGQSGMVVLSNPTPPGPPTIGQATPGNGQANIAFTSGTVGSSPTLDFTATCTTSTGGAINGSGTSATSPITVSPLTNGALYSCTVTARNAVGTSGASGAVNVTPTVPITIPGAPTINSVTPGISQATVNFSPPASDGGSALDYIASCGGLQAAGLSSPITVFGLANANTYMCTVVAHNSAGNGPASNPFLVTLPSTPNAPVVGMLTPGDTAASIAFTPPASDGGSAIIDFSATCNPGAIVRVNMASPIAFAPGSLVNGTTYTCTLTARNAVGTGAASPTFQVTPASVPGAPVITSVIGGDGQASVFFAPPASNGGAVITSYRAQCDSPGVNGASSPITVSPLGNDVTVNCSVFATNAIGNGAPSATVAVTPSAMSALTPVAVYSRKTHGAAGDFNLPVDTTPNVVTAEPRLPGEGHLIVFQFNVPIISEGTASVTPVGTTAVTKSGYEVQVKLINVADNQRADVVLSGVNGSGVSVTARLGFLVGDVNNSKAVSASDISALKARSGQATSNQNFLFDLNTSGTISPQDVSTAKARSGLVLPP